MPLLKTGQAIRSQELEKLWQKYAGYELIWLFFCQFDFSTAIGHAKKIKFLLLFSQLSIG